VLKLKGRISASWTRLYKTANRPYLLFEHRSSRLERSSRKRKRNVTLLSRSVPTLFGGIGICKHFPDGTRTRTIGAQDDLTSLGLDFRLFLPPLQLQVAVDQTK
jgi:hypothetical protein